MSNPYCAELLAKGAYCCVECGKCVALCPMAETAKPFSREKSPRGFIQQALDGVPLDAMPALTHCLQCRSCSTVCPAGVDVAGLIAALRLQMQTFHVLSCVRCGTPLFPENATAYLAKAIDEGFETTLSYPNLCPDCKRRAYIRNNS